MKLTNNIFFSVPHSERYSEFQATLPPSSPSRSPLRTLWKPPPLDTFKINFDGAVFAEENYSGVGVIIRNREGLVIAALSEKIPQLLQPIEIEAMAATRALEFAREERGQPSSTDLAKLAVTIPDCIIWMEDVPSDVLDSYQADLAGLS
ncbi:hypothetical protein SO802_012841 [Lithocarpus litseifolius]|uniref:RNase H type-1 domain-containing protein n=1 Tax=Lithocarpus litseifolius TaxID=425828 RepID=A0AAW2D3Z0_9ROSI